MANTKPKDEAQSDANADTQPVDNSNGLLKDATELGFFGEKVDPEPNSVYTIAGQTKGK